MNARNKNNHINTELLFEAILSLETAEECHIFFEDICTAQEVRTISQRLEVAKLLSEQKIYSDIVTETGTSTATISRVNRSLHYGSGGYKLVLSRINKK